MNQSANMSVVFSIHGGGYLIGNSSYVSQGPDYLLDEDVVFVSFNYRLGIFGFLSTGDSASPGNYGLKDQLLALKWVNKNIGKFGGNPKDVTIFGESAGSASVSYFIQSQKAEGLFQAGIMDSGTSLCRWSKQRNARDFALKLGSTFYNITDNSTEIIEYLRTVNYMELQSNAFKLAIYVSTKL